MMHNGVQFCQSLAESNLAMFLPIRATPYVRLIRRLFSGPGFACKPLRMDRIFSVRKKRVAIPPAVFLPGQIDRVTGVVNNAWVNTIKEARD